jgi:hypothetical protein
LCINQEDEQDKQHEISFMGNIYAESELNLAATAASSGSDGLFHTRNPMEVEPFRKRVRFYGDNGWIHGDIIVNTTEFDHQVDLAPLNKRGWVFQERLLAPRVLHFARDQVYWTCSSLLAAEVMPYGNPALRSFFGDEIRRWHLDVPLGQSPIRTHQNSWTILTFNYSMTSLTFPQDKLVAISAISRKMCKVRNLSPRDYLAGLWRPDLPAQLLWFVLDPWGNNTKSLPYIAPSWSWASLVTNKMFPVFLSRDSTVADLVDASMSLKTTDPFGELTSGYIRLRGPMCKLSRRISPLTGAVELDLLGTYHKRNVIRTRWDYVELPEEISTPEDRDCHCKNLTPPHLYLFLIKGKQGKVPDSRSGLILQPIDGGKGKYQRLGYFDIDNANFDLAGSRLDFFSANTLDDNEFISSEGSSVYIIDIF